MVCGLIAVSLLPFARAAFDDDPPVGEMVRPGGTSAISQAVDDAIAADRKMWSDYNESLQHWFDREAMGGHSVQVLGTGLESYQARVNLIRSAKYTIYLSAYAFNDDETGKSIAYELCLKAQSGVDVRLILDGLGSHDFKSGAYKDLFGCGAYIFFDSRAHGSITDLPYVIHEKLMIVDGRSFIIGGSGYSNKYYHSSRFDDHWHDMDAQISGPAACWFHKRFAQNWLNLTKRAVHNSYDAMGAGGMSDDAQEYYYGNSSLFEVCDEIVAGTAKVLPRYNNPFFSSDRPNLTAHISATVASKKSINLYAPYYVPSKRMVQALLAARAKGVKVTIITNSPWSTDDMDVIFIGMYDRIKPLMDAGVEIRMWNRKNTMHRKGGNYDDRWVYYGSDNQDNRGQDFSSESIAFTDDAAVIARFKAEYEADLKETFVLTPQFIKKHLSKFSGIKKTITSWIEDML